MAVQFLPGRIVPLIDYCSNDMETETLGAITALTHQTNVGTLAFSNSRFTPIGANYCDQDMESLTVGVITSLPIGHQIGDTMWVTSGRFTQPGVNYGSDDMESYAVATITSLTQSTDVGDTSLGTGRFV
jgi:hypothetical protein